MTRASLPFLMVLLILATMAGACARTSGEAALRSEIRVPVRAEAEGEHAGQRRSIPWREETLRVQVRYHVLEDEEEYRPVGETPGLRAARARLRARNDARRELAARLAQLPAADPPPGERETLNLEEFSRRRSGMDDFISLQIEEAPAEELRGNPIEGFLLTLDLPMEPLAAEVLRRGGGFRPDGELSFARLARARAQQEAVEQARRELLGELLLREPVRGLTIAQWIQRDGYNRQQFLAATGRIAVLRSELQDDPESGEAWTVELEFDPEPLEAIIRRGERERQEAGEATPR